MYKYIGRYICRCICSCICRYPCRYILSTFMKSLGCAINASQTVYVGRPASRPVVCAATTRAAARADWPGGRIGRLAGVPDGGRPAVLRQGCFFHMGCPGPFHQSLLLFMRAYLLKGQMTTLLTVASWPPCDFVYLVFGGCSLKFMFVFRSFRFFIVLQLSCFS